MQERAVSDKGRLNRVFLLSRIRGSLDQWGYVGTPHILAHTTAIAGLFFIFSSGMRIG